MRKTKRKYMIIHIRIEKSPPIVLRLFKHQTIEDIERSDKYNENCILLIFGVEITLAISQSS